MINKKNYINLFKTRFKMKGDLNLSQLKIINFWNNNNIYKKIILKKNKYFIIHDGPPFTNGEIHLGHILNKILKDIIIKFKNICGYKSCLIPGWDCFGLPINNKFKKNINNKEIINYVNYVIKDHINSFLNLGIFFNPNYIYKTMSYKNISDEIRILYNYNKKNLIYQDFKLLNWCSKCKKYLSKSEIIYKKNIVLSWILFFLFLNFFFLKNLKIKKKYLLGGILIWTTLPWTLLSNQNLLLEKEYIYLYINLVSGNFILNFQEYIRIKKKIKKKFFVKKFFLSIFLKKINNFINPLFKLNIFFFRKSPLIILKNNLKNIGTGIIHISPNHGLEDLKIYKKNYNINFKLINLFFKNGLFNKKIFYKKNIFFLNRLIINYLLKYNIFFLIKKYNHNQMFCLKHKKKPVFYKSTKQWFLKFKNIFKKKINKIKFLPKKSKNKFKNLLKKKPKWNISRQKFWGVYIPNIIFKKYKFNFLLKFISNYLEIYNIKLWILFSKIDVFNFNSVFLKKIYETLDVWFDSGITHWNILRNTHKNILKFPSNIYIEGEDQHRGWFQSSLITSLLLDKKIPFKKLISHGFIKTIYGDKFSKSLKNYINYKNLINYTGIDILRLLFCNIKYTKNIILTKNLLNNTIDIYRKIRNFLRFILCNLSDLKLNINFNFSNLNINNYLINYLNKFNKKIFKLYKKYNFNKILNKIKKIISDDISSIYFNIIKNNLYINILNCKKRKKIQITMLILFNNINIILLPISPLIIEESNLKLFYNYSIFLKKFLFIKKKLKFNFWLIIKYIKYIFYKKLEYLKKKKKINNFNLKLIIFLNKKLYIFFLKNKINFINLFSLYKIKINLTKKNFFFILFKFYNNYKCFRCWKKKKILNNNICFNCYFKLYKQNIYL